MAEPSKEMRRMLTVVQHAHAVTDRRFKEAADSTPGTVSCRAGCAHCCKQLVTVTLPEAFAMVASLPVSEAMKLLGAHASRLVEQCDYLLRLDARSREWFARGTRCVFLTDNDRCAVYAARPIACRTHAVVSSPENCAPGAADSTVAAIRVRNARFEAFGELDGAAGEVGLSRGLFPLPIAVTLALFIGAGREGLASALWDEAQVVFNAPELRWALLDLFDNATSWRKHPEGGFECAACHAISTGEAGEKALRDLVCPECKSDHRKMTDTMQELIATLQGDKV